MYENNSARPLQSLVFETDDKDQAQIIERLAKIENQDYFGNNKRLSKNLFELKFNNGNRIYYTVKMIGEDVMIIILGGNKNGQQKDIDKAQKTADKIHSE